jgi:hypothetical protein
MKNQENAFTLGNLSYVEALLVGRTKKMKCKARDLTGFNVYKELDRQRAHQIQLS